MRGTEVLRLSLEQSRNWLLTLVTDMKDAPLAFPTSKGGNHPLWVLGHVALSEESMLAGFVLGEPSRKPEWEKLFGMGSEPCADVSAYPSFESVLAEYARIREHTLQVLSGFTDADLGKPSKAPAHLQSMFGTVAHCFSMIALHTTYHAGQVADARRALGRKPLFA